MKEILLKSNELFINTICCHKDGRICNCYNCWKNNFYQTPDNYDCFKSLCFYTLNYGPAFASEIYHYFSKSKIIEKFIKEEKDVLNIISLGCGFAPDMIALDKYIKDNYISLKINFTGIDNEKSWEKIRIPLEFTTFKHKDLLTGFNLSGYDIIIINKLYSTLYRNNKSTKFMSLLLNQCKHNLLNNSYVIFIDILGEAKEEFDNKMCKSKIFTDITYYYFRNGSYNHKFISKKINEIDNVFKIPSNLEITPKKDVNKTIIFEYRK